MGQALETEGRQHAAPAQAGGKIPERPSEWERVVRAGSEERALMPLRAGMGQG